MRHAALLPIFDRIFGVLCLLPALVMSIFAFFLRQELGATGIAEIVSHASFRGTSIALAVLGIACLVVSTMIPRGRGRLLQTVVAAFSLFLPPFGTILGIYAIWVCWFSPQMLEHFEQPAADPEGGWPAPPAEAQTPVARDRNPVDGGRGLREQPGGALDRLQAIEQRRAGGASAAPSSSAAAEVQAPAPENEDRDQPTVFEGKHSANQGANGFVPTRIERGAVPPLPSPAQSHDSFTMVSADWTGVSGSTRDYLLAAQRLRSHPSESGYTHLLIPTEHAVVEQTLSGNQISVGLDTDGCVTAGEGTIAQIWMTLSLEGDHWVAYLHSADLQPSVAGVAVEHGTRLGSGTLVRLAGTACFELRAGHQSLRGARRSSDNTWRMVRVEGPETAPEGLEIGTDTAVLGRDPDARAGEGAVTIPDLPPLSANHATMWTSGGYLFLADEGSTVGTTLNGQPLLPHRTFLLRSNDLVRFADSLAYRVTE